MREVTQFTTQENEGPAHPAVIDLRKIGARKTDPLEELHKGPALKGQQRCRLTEKKLLDVVTDPVQVVGLDLLKNNRRAPTNGQCTPVERDSYSVGIFVNPTGPGGTGGVGTEITFILHRLHLGHRVLL